MSSIGTDFYAKGQLKRVSATALCLRRCRSPYGNGIAWTAVLIMTGTYNQDGTMDVCATVKATEVEMK